MKQLLAGLLFAGLVQSVLAAEVVVQVIGVSSSEGRVGCLIFNAPEGFPMTVGKAIKQQAQAVHLL